MKPRWRTYYANLSAQVTVTKYTANRILVLGDVTTPGMVTFDGTPTLLEALTRSGLETRAGQGSEDNADSRALRDLSRPEPGDVGGAQEADELRQRSGRPAPAPRRCGVCAHAGRALCLGARPGAEAGRSAVDRQFNSGQRACQCRRIHRTGRQQAAHSHRRSEPMAPNARFQ